MKVFRYGIAALVFVALGWLVVNSRAATETASYKVVEKQGEFEIRDYPALGLVTTPMSSETDDDGSFSRLFGFISGKNAREEKIAMTTPVFIDRDKPSASMSFVLPQEIAEKGAPQPQAAEVKLKTRAAGRFAVIRFQGKGTREEEAIAQKKLSDWLQERGLTAAGEPVVAYYDPPWTPATLKRNEVLIPVSNDQR